MKHKFKVGDKVRILPSARSIAVWEEEIGKIGRITSDWLGYDSFEVKMLLPCKDGITRNWSMGQGDMAPVIEVGQQLLFSFMSDADNTQYENEIGERYEAT